jgi:phosphoglucosamine mutase
LRLTAGIVISASHNPYDDNGIKFFSADGAKLPDAVELAIEERMASPLVCVASAELGKARRVDDASGRYIEFCKATYPNELDLKGRRIVVDCAHGAAYHVAPLVFHELGAEVIAIGDQPNGTNINDGFGATNPEALKRAVVEHHADLGIGLDGDGDRLVMVDSEGRAYDGDQLLYVIALDYRRRGALFGGIVGTLMTNLGFEQALAREGIPSSALRSATVTFLKGCRQRAGSLAAKIPGICYASTNTRPAMRSSPRWRCCARWSSRRRHWPRQRAGVLLCPQRLINVRVPKGYDWRADAAIRAAETDARAALGSTGRILLRPSGTEPVLRVMVEAADRPTADAFAQRVANSIAATLERVSG